AQAPEVVGMQQIRGTLDEGVEDAEPLAELEEAAAVEALVGEVGAEVVEGLLTPVGPREHDLHARYRVTGAGRDDLPLCVDRYQRALMDSLPGAREEQEKHGQHAVEPAAAQVIPHVARNEEAVVQRRADRRPQSRQ